MLVAVAGRYTVTNFEGMGSEDLLGPNLVNVDLLLPPLSNLNVHKEFIQLI